MSGHTVIPAEKHPQQPGEKPGDPVIPSLPALTLGGTPTRAPPGRTSAGAAPVLGAACSGPAQAPQPPSAIGIRPQMARGWPRCRGVEGKGGSPPLETASQGWGGSLLGLGGGGGSGICSHLPSGGNTCCRSGTLEANACLRETSLTDILHK